MANQDRTVRVTSVGGDRLEITVRGHTMHADQPAEDGGGDTGPTPTEIFVAGLAGCIAYYAERFLRRHGLPVDGLVVGCEYEWAENPHRVGGIALTVDAPGLTRDKRPAFERVVEHCTVHNTLLQPPKVTLVVHNARTEAA